MSKREYFDKTYMPCYKQMYQAAMAMLGDTDDAADAVQASMLELWEKADPHSPPLNPKAFALAMIRHRCLRIIGDKLETSQLDTLSDTLTNDPLFDNDNSDSDLLEQCLTRLPRSEETAIRLNAFAGYTSEEIAKELNTSPGNARQLLCRGRKRLKLLFSKS